MLKTNVKKILFALLAFIFVFSMTTSVFATDMSNSLTINTTETENTVSNAITNDDSVYANTTMELVENNVCTIDVGGYGEFTKQITEFNESEKSATLTLTMTNLKKVEESQKDAEIFFVIDNSSSMLQEYKDTTRKQSVINSANSLVEKLFKTNPNVKIGLVGFSSLDSSKGETEGTINDATLRLGLSNSEADVKEAITNLSELEVGPRTNIEAGLTIAEDNFSQDENVSRYIILLTDGVPNNATDGTSMKYSGVVAQRTKTKIQEIEDKNIDIIGAMINLDSEKVEPDTQKTYRELAEEIFGTEESSTLSKYFYIPDDEIENTIVNEIFDSLIIRTDNTLRNITIVDYFPQEIIDNFNFEYVASPNIGTVSQEINKENNSITWNIELLSEGETATLSYKLTLKEDYNQEIIDVVLPTNTHVDITGETNEGEIDNTSDVSPTIVVRYEKPAKPVDNTIITDNKLPQTGQTVAWFLAIATVLVAIMGGRMLILNKKINKNK